MFVFFFFKLNNLRGLMPGLIKKKTNKKKQANLYSIKNLKRVIILHLNKDIKIMSKHTDYISGNI